MTMRRRLFSASPARRSGSRERRPTPQTTVYGRKKSEGKDFNEDTNFGKLKRIPHVQLQAFLKKHRLDAAKGTKLSKTVREVRDLDVADLQNEELD